MEFEKDREKLIMLLRRTKRDWAVREVQRLSELSEEEAATYFSSIRYRDRVFRFTSGVMVVLACLMKDGYNYNSIFSHMFGQYNLDDYYFGFDLFLNVNFYFSNLVLVVLLAVVFSIYDKSLVFYTRYYLFSFLLGSIILIVFQLYITFGKQDMLPRLPLGQVGSAVLLGFSLRHMFIGVWEIAGAIRYMKKEHKNG